MYMFRRMIYRIEDVLSGMGCLDDNSSKLRNMLIALGVAGAVGFAVYANEVQANSSLAMQAEQTQAQE